MTEQQKSEKPKKAKRKRIRGFAGIIWNSIKDVNGSEYFMKNYGDLDFKVYLVSIDDRHTALVTVKNGTVDCEDIKYDKKDPKSLKKLLKELDYDALLMTDTENFFKIASGKMSKGGLLKMVLTRKIRGVKVISTFAKFFKVSAIETKKKAAAKAAAKSSA